MLQLSSSEFDSMGDVPLLDTGGTNGVPSGRPHQTHLPATNSGEFHQSHGTGGIFSGGDDFTTLSTTAVYSQTNNLMLKNTNAGESFSPDFLSPTQVSHQISNTLKTPSVYSNNSLYSENSTPNSPYGDNISQVSANQNPPTNLTVDPYDYEIALGGSISSNNLVGLNTNAQYNSDVPNAFVQPPLFSFEDFDKQTSQQLQPDQPMVNHPTTDFSQAQQVLYDQQQLFQDNDQLNTRLTENNLSNYNQQLQNTENDIVISIQQAPEIIAARTPSLFSNSSANSSVHSRTSSAHNNSSIKHQNSSHGQDNLVPTSHQTPQSPGSTYSTENDELLKPDEFLSMKRGRKKSHSYKTHSRNTSTSSFSRSSGLRLEDDADESEALNASSREKMLELASPNMSSKRTQKHPSAYSCHLCEKKFTRPYNLKSHLRTHTDERPFICNVCGKAFARQHDRKRHEDLHTGEKKFQCKGLLKDGTVYGCGRKFARADALRRHFQTEAGKECIRLLIEEEEREKKLNPKYKHEQSEFLSPPTVNVPQVAISPPE
jgi:uncharacterized Zn-finger protein